MVVSSLRPLSGHRADASKVRAGSGGPASGVFFHDDPAVQERVGDRLGARRFLRRGEYMPRTASVRAFGRPGWKTGPRACWSSSSWRSSPSTAERPAASQRFHKQLAAIDELPADGTGGRAPARCDGGWLRRAETRTKDRRELALEAGPATRPEVIDDRPGAGEDEFLKSAFPPAGRQRRPFRPAARRRLHRRRRGAGEELSAEQ